MDTCDLSVVMEKKDTVPTGRRDPPPPKKKGEEGSCHMKIRVAPLKFRHYEWGEPPKSVLKHQREMPSQVQSQNHQNSPTSKPFHHGSLGVRLLWDGDLFRWNLFPLKAAALDNLPVTFTPCLGQRFFVFQFKLPVRGERTFVLSLPGHLRPSVLITALSERRC